VGKTVIKVKDALAGSINCFVLSVQNSPNANPAEWYHVSVQVCSYCKIPVLASEMQYSMQHYSSKGCAKAIEPVKVVVARIVPTQ